MRMNVNISRHILMLSYYYISRIREKIKKFETSRVMKDFKEVMHFIL